MLDKFQEFLPPYSPFLNPIEEVFSKWKSALRRSAPKDQEELYNNIHISSQSITNQDCSNYIKHMESYLPKCKNRQIISS